MGEMTVRKAVGYCLQMMDGLGHGIKSITLRHGQNVIGF